ncbi:MAG: hypothetical protein NW218_06385 [Saprospiraceae bacterium]|nr:hypothetical protein [Saprospiraceae bacterium]
MNEDNFYLLLDVIFRNGSAKRLTRNGVDFSEIAIQTNHAIAEGLVKNSGNRIILTEKGVEALKRLEDKYKKTKKEEWIEKDEKSRVDKKDKSFIFVPRQSELTF